MRERLFRGKWIDTGAWVYGAYLAHDYDGHTIFNQNLGDGSLQGFEVIPETVGQSTGLKDRNGVEIYGGDIVIDERGNKAYIAFLRQEMGYVLVFEKHDSRLGHRNRGSGYDSDLSLEVIGNITDNPELVGKKK